jgi:PAS domain S-box-containing protein
LLANRALCKLSGRPEKELVGRSYDELLHPDEQNADDAGRRAMLAGRTQRLASERRFLVADGSAMVVRINLSLIRDTAGEPLHFVAQVEDVTERLRMTEALTLSEARYKALIAHLPDSTLHLFDHDLRLLLCEGDRMLSHDYEPQALEGRLLDEVLPAEAYELLAPAYRAALAGEPRSFDLDSSDGKATYWVQMGPLRDDGGHVIGGMAISRDISDRRHAERTLQQHALELERSNAELEQFAYVASHDLQEPLRKVASFCQLLERRYKGQLDERGEQYIEFAVDGAKRMQQLINDLLSFSRVGRVTTGFAQVDLGQAFAQALAQLQSVIEEAAATVSADPLPTVRGEQSLLVQLFQNLVGNGVKFHGEAAPIVHVSAQRSGDMWEFCCRDNGIGIEPQYEDKIFVIFQRLHGRDVYGGTGIGLALCKKIVEYHGGRMWLDTAVTAGAAIRWTLPAEEEGPQHDDASAGPADRGLAGGGRPG